MNETKIRWTHSSWNPVSGCSKVSDGCRFCYAATISLKFKQTSKPWTLQNEAENVIMKPHKLHEPYTLGSEPQRCFVNSMSDLFHRVIPDWYRAAVFCVMLDLPHIVFQVLTKRSDATIHWHEQFLAAVRSDEFKSFTATVKHKKVKAALLKAESYATPWSANIWQGVSIEDARVLNRIDDLRQCGAVVRFISAEPLLGAWGKSVDLNGIHWIIVGGESGKHINEHPDRFMKPEWAREIRDLCIDQGVAFFYKQDSGYTTELRPYLVEEDTSRWEWMQYPDDVALPVRIEGDKRDEQNAEGKSFESCLARALHFEREAYIAPFAYWRDIAVMYAAYWYEAAARLRPALPLPLQIVPQLETPLIPPTFPLLLAVILPDGVARSSDPRDPGFVPPEFVYVIGTEYARLDQVDKTRELYERHQKYLQSEEGKQLTAQTDAMMQDRVVDPDPIPDVPINKIEPDYADPFDLPTNTKVLSLWQPWASLLMINAKHIETRSWGTPHRGTLVIHAAKKWDYENIPYATLEEPFVSALRAAGLDPNNLPLGAALGTVILDTVQDTSAVRDMLNVQELAFGNFEDGRKAWCVSRPKAFKNPLKVNGRQGLRHWKEYLEEIAPASEPMKMFEQPAPPDAPINKTRVVNFQDVKAHWDTKRRMWDSDEYAYIGRQNGNYGLPESRFANPFKITSDTPENRAYAIEQYRLWLTAKLVDPFADTAYRVELETLRGKTLVCWCSSDSPAKSKACHGDVLLKALGEPPEAHSHAEPERMTEAASIQMSMFGDFKTYA